MSSTSIPEKRYYFSKVLQRTAIEPRPGMESRVLVDFQLLRRKGVCSDDARVIITEQSWSKTATNIPFSNYLRPEFSELIEFMTSDLLLLGVPNEEHRIILDKLHQVVQVLQPERRIFVLISEITVRFSGSFHDFDTLLTGSLPMNITLQFDKDQSVDRYQLGSSDYHGAVDTMVLQESFGALTIKFIPASRSSIESLQKVKLDSLEQAAIKQIPTCSICKDEFAEDSDDQLITHLPCAHHFHADCISQWLERSHLCPLCRYALPTVEDGEPSTLN